MEKEEFRKALDEMGYTQQQFADQVGVTLRGCQRWALGEARIPGSVELLIRLMQLRPELVGLVKEMKTPDVRERS